MFAYCEVPNVMHRFLLNTTKKEGRDKKHTHTQMSHSSSRSPTTSVVAALSRAIATGDILDLEEAMRTYECELAACRHSISSNSASDTRASSFKNNDDDDDDESTTMQLVLAELTAPTAQLAYNKAQQTYLRHFDVCRHDILRLRDALRRAHVVCEPTLPRAHTGIDCSSSGSDVSTIANEKEDTVPAPSFVFRHLADTVSGVKKRSGYCILMARDIQRCSLFLARVSDTAAEARTLLHRLHTVAERGEREGEQQHRVCSPRNDDGDEEEEEQQLYDDVERFLARCDSYVPLAAVGELRQWQKSRGVNDTSSNRTSFVCGGANAASSRTDEVNEKKQEFYVAARATSSSSSPQPTKEAMLLLPADEATQRQGIDAYETQSRATLLSRHLQAVSRLRLHWILNTRSSPPNSHSTHAAVDDRSSCVFSSTTSCSPPPPPQSLSLLLQHSSTIQRRGEETPHRKTRKTAHGDDDDVSSADSSSGSDSTSSSDERQLRYFLEAFSGKRLPMQIAASGDTTTSPPPLERQEDNPEKGSNAKRKKSHKHVPILPSEQDGEEESSNQKATKIREFIDVPDDNTIVESAAESKMETSIEQVEHRDLQQPPGRRPAHHPRHHNNNNNTTSGTKLSTQQRPPQSAAPETAQRSRCDGSVTGIDTCNRDDDDDDGIEVDCGVEDDDDKYPVEGFLDLIASPTTKHEEGLGKELEEEEEPQSDEKQRQQAQPSSKPRTSASTTRDQSSALTLLRTVYSYPFASIVDAEARHRCELATQQDNEREQFLVSTQQQLQHQQALHHAQLVQLQTHEGRKRRDVEQQEIGAREGGIAIAALRARSAMMDWERELRSARAAMVYAEAHVRRRLELMEHETSAAFLPPIALIRRQQPQETQLEAPIASVADEAKESVKADVTNSDRKECIGEKCDEDDLRWKSCSVGRCDGFILLIKHSLQRRINSPSW